MWGVGRSLREALRDKGHHRRGGGFTFPEEWNTSLPGFTEVVRLMFSMRPARPPRDVASVFPSVAFSDPDTASLAPNTAAVSWAGHSTFLVETGGFRIMTDPVFSARASPFSFAGPKRYTEPAFDAQIAADVVVVSHNHYDHCDTTSIGSLAELHDPLFIVPLGTAGTLSSAVRPERIIECDWFESVTVVRDTDSGRAVGCVDDADLDGDGPPPAVERSSLRARFLPAVHWTSRSGLSRNSALWGSFLLESADGPSVYFGGDTAYNEVVFRELGSMFSIDVALIPIGAYEPRWFMARQHVNPEEAVKIMRDLGAQNAVAMHFGTFSLTSEPVDAPVKDLAVALADQDDVHPLSFKVPKHGERFLFKAPQ